MTAKAAEIPLKFIRATGVTIIEPGQKLLAKEGKLLPQDPPEAVQTLIEFDEMMATSTTWDKSKQSK